MTRCQKCGTAPVRKRRGARYCSRCVARLPKKTCRSCGVSFAPDMMAGRRCKPCVSKANHAKRILAVYGITAEQYDQLLEFQGGACYICRRKPGTKRLAVDHDHSCCPGPTSCGRCVRGLLCRTDNRGLLGHVENLPTSTAIEALERAIDYLENPPAKEVLG